MTRIILRRMASTRESSAYRSATSSSLPTSRLASKGPLHPTSYVFATRSRSRSNRICNTANNTIDIFINLPTAPRRCSLRPSHFPSHETSSERAIKHHMMLYIPVLSVSLSTDNSSHRSVIQSVSRSMHTSSDTSNIISISPPMTPRVTHRPSSQTTCQPTYSKDLGNGRTNPNDKTSIKSGLKIDSLGRLSLSLCSTLLCFLRPCFLLPCSLMYTPGH